MKMNLKTSLVTIGTIVGTAFVLASCTGDTVDQMGNQAQKITEVQFEKYTLANGLDVVLHVDKSDPIVAIDLAVHVGSSRELAGRTGFAHLFEHLLFMDSENLGFGGLDEMNTRIGGDGTNGFTTNDMTQYFQSVPKDGLEKIIWAEADKIGYFINTVTNQVIDKEKEVVKNEKRQRVDNRPYGHRWYIVGKALYGENHPYNWQVIGSLEDLEAAELADVEAFYKKWYVPNNVTVTLSGDFDVPQAKKWIEKYFAEIPRGADVAKIEPQASGITETKSLYYEDNFAAAPELSMSWPTVPQYHKDAYALDVLSTYLGSGKRAPFNEVLIDEEKITSSVSVFANFAEIAGEFYVLVDAKEGEDIDGLGGGITKAFARFEENGISEADLGMIKTAQEVAFYDNLQSALGKAIQLGEYNMFTGDPGFINTDLKNMQAVTTADVMRVYNTYIKNKPHVLISIVPKGHPELALEGAVLASIVEEKVVQSAEKKGAEKNIKATDGVRNFTRTPSSFDRTVEPEFGAAYDLPTPDVWRAKLANDIDVYGIESTETSLVYFSLRIDAGREHGDIAKPGVANLTADMLSKGTTLKTNAELEDAISALGSSITASASAETAYITGSSLSRNFSATIALVEEMLLQPRWDAEEFALLKSEKIDAVILAAANPNSIASREIRKLRYPEDHIFHYTSYGSKDSLGTIELADLKAFYKANYTPKRAKLKVVGAVNQGDVEKAFAGISAKWQGDARENIILPPSADLEKSKVYFYDVPGSKQSVLRIQRPSLKANDADYALAKAMNFPLGGIYTSELNAELRVNKGYTYGVRSSFNGGADRGLFAISSSVRSNVTLESLTIIRDIVANYGPMFTDEDLTIMKGALLRGQALKNETLSDKLSMLNEISTYGFDSDFRTVNAKRIDAMSLAEFKRLADDYLRPDAMFYLVVGDAKSQFARLKDLGFGEPVLLNPDATDK